MPLYAEILVAALAAIGAALIAERVWRWLKLRRESFVCISFDGGFPEGRKPDLIFICRTEAEQEEILRRICENDDRKIIIKRM